MIRRLVTPPTDADTGGWSSHERGHRWSPDREGRRAVGVRRISAGHGLSQAAYSLARRAAVEALANGTYETLADADDFGAVNGAFSR